MGNQLLAVRLKRGSLRLSRATCEAYFAGLDAVILLPWELELFILPVRHAGGGGFLLKTINADGDRAVHAGELLRALGVEEDYLEGTEERRLGARWSPVDAALIVSLDGLLRREHERLAP